jgi:hypothetical protein
MSIPIPDYIKNIARTAHSNKNWLTVSIHCECGSDEFFLYKSKFPKEAQEMVKQNNDEYIKVLGGHMPHFRWDEDKILRTYIREGRVEKEIILPKPLSFAALVVYKVKCNKCKKEYVIFDNSIHGYDAVNTDSAPKMPDFQLEFTERAFKDNSPKRIHIKYENNESIEEFFDSTDEEVNELKYSNSFSWIVIYAIGQNSKKTQVYSEETA